MIALLRIVEVLLNVIWWIIVVQAILSWLLAFNVINQSNDFVRSVWYALQRMTEPFVPADPPHPARFRRARPVAAGRAAGAVHPPDDRHPHRSRKSYVSATYGV